MKHKKEVREIVDKIEQDVKRMLPGHDFVFMLKSKTGNDDYFSSSLYGDGLEKFFKMILDGLMSEGMKGELNGKT